MKTRHSASITALFVVVLLFSLAPHSEAVPAGESDPSIYLRRGGPGRTASFTPITGPRTRGWRTALPEPLFQLMESDARAIAAYEKALPSLINDKKRTRWMPRDTFPKTALEEAMTRLAKLADPGPEFAGYEWWVQQVDSNAPLGFHVDKDESVASNKHFLVHPIWSSIMYLTDIGGGTLIPTQWSPQGNGYSPVDPVDGEYSFPARNKFLVFNGTYLHGVIEGEKVRGQRITFLINWWSYKPEAPNCEYLRHKDVKGLRLYSREEMLALKQQLDDWVKDNAEIYQQPEVFTKIDMTRKTKVPHRDYTIRLPGNGQERVKIPTKTETGASYLLRWASFTDPEHRQRWFANTTTTAPGVEEALNDAPTAQSETSAQKRGEKSRYKPKKKGKRDRTEL